MLRSSIDLGTNTCLLLIADCDPASGEVLRTVEDHATVVRLGQGVDRAKELHPDAIERTISCLRRYAEAARAQGLDPSSTLAVATSQARDARNGAEFFKRVERETGFRFRTLSGDDEAKYTFLGGLLPGMKPESCAVIDIGGGSTEIMASSGGKSVDLGSVRFTERFLRSDPVTDAEFWACRAAVDEGLKEFVAVRARMPKEIQLVGVAGTATTLAQWFLESREFQRERIDEVVLAPGDLHRLVEELKWRTVEERTRLPGVTEGRADVLLAGALILWRATEVLGFRDCRVSTRGLRYGVLQMR